MILNGKELSEKIKVDIKAHVEEYKEKFDKEYKLVVIQVGDNQASNLYIRNKEKACDFVGIKSELIKLDESITEYELKDVIISYNYDDTVTGILVQLPLPKHINEKNIISCINPEKDVDGFNELNVGNMFLGNKTIYPCTPLGIIKMLEYYNIDVDGKNCVVVGRSNIVGKPIAMMLLNKNGTVTICNSHTKNLKEICKTADILICAIGKPKFFNRDYIKNGAVVIDVGINRDENNKLCGDVDFEDVKDIVYAISPVPNGVGAMTVTMLLQNCIDLGDYTWWE